MNYEWIDGYLLAKKGAVKDYKVEWDAERFLLGDKMFAMKGGDKHGKPILTLKCDVAFGKALRERYAYVVPGYYMNKDHWNSVYFEGDTPDDVIRQMADMSYELVLASLPKKKQTELLGES